MPEKPAVDCAATEKIELLLTDLVPTAAVGYGRIDPFLYEVDQDGAIHVVSSAVPKDEAAAEDALDLLKLVNENRAAQETFRNNIARSKLACDAGKCPTDAAHEVRLLERTPIDGGLETITYSLGTAPSEGEKNAFLELMAIPGSPGCRPVTNVRIEESLLRVTRLPADCHSSANGHSSDLGNPCTTVNVPKGVWEKRDLSPKRPRHCCISK